MKNRISNILVALLVWESAAIASHYAGKLPVGVYGEQALEKYCNENPGEPECIDAE